jgi:Terminase large subunit, T4likevirus-type, N-terminal
LDPWQRDVIVSEALRQILNCSRQSGKSTTAAVLALWECLYVPNSLTILISPTLRQSSELFKKVTALKNDLPFVPDLLEDNRLSLWVRGAGRIVSLPGSEDTIRGFSGASLVIEDEASRVTDDLHVAVRPMTATVENARYICMSTPRGKVGHFHDLWEAGHWERTRVTAYDCPRIPEAFLEEQKREMPAWVFAQEFMCEFSDMVDGVFAHDDIQAALSDDSIQPLFGGF